MADRAVNMWSTVAKECHNIQHNINTNEGKQKQASNWFDEKATLQPHMDGSIVFARWQQCAPHLIILPWIHPSPQPKRQLNWFSSFCTVHDSQSTYITMGRPSPPQNCPSWVDLDSHLIHGSSGPPESIIQTASQSVQRFLQASQSSQTDRSRHSICNNRPHLRSTVMWPKNH